jgi:hypothetical protein
MRHKIITAIIVGVIGLMPIAAQAQVYDPAQQLCKGKWGSICYSRATGAQCFDGPVCGPCLRAVPTVMPQ